MGDELGSAWTAAVHLTELVAAHGLFEAGKGPASRVSRKVAAWLRSHLPEEDLPKLGAVEKDPYPASSRAALQLAINSLLNTQPELLAELRGLLHDARVDHSYQQQTVGDNALRWPRKTGQVAKRDSRP
jgi:hypothetical protein